MVYGKISYSVKSKAVKIFSINGIAVKSCRNFTAFGKENTVIAYAKFVAVVNLNIIKGIIIHRVVTEKITA